MIVILNLNDWNLKSCFEFSMTFLERFLFEIDDTKYEFRNRRQQLFM